MKKSRRVRWEVHVACVEEIRNAYKIVVGKPEGERKLGRRKRRCEDNIKMDRMEIRLKGVDWIHLVQDRLFDWLL
jgi:hypothetical protein